MIQRHMKHATEIDFENFDYFNDYEDTRNFLTGVLYSAIDEKEKLRIGEIIDKFRAHYNVYLETHFKNYDHR